MLHQAPKKQILAICGSLRTESSNYSILKFLANKADSLVNFDIYNGLSEIPAYDPGLDNETPPESVKKLRRLLAEADGIVICTPEYAFGIPGALKNALDWMVSSGSFMAKPVSLITASTGGENAHTALLKVLGAIDANVLENATLLISFIRSKMDGSGKITNIETADSIVAAYNALLENILEGGLPI